MKAKDLIKKERPIEELRKEIVSINDGGGCAMFIHRSMYVSEKTKMQLINDGFKVSIGDWDGMMTNVVIIEW